MTKEKFLDIIAYLRSTISGTRYEGHVYAVGGAVRDFVMGNEIKDVDLVIDLDKGGIDFARFLFSKGLLCHEPVVYPTYGTAMFRLSKFPDDELEAVYTRGEKYVEGSRNPATTFSTLDEDCFRRDLTINALYYGITSGEILDLTGNGLKDIEEHRIRVTNPNPDIVFKDDPLRILRVIRFASRYGWNVEPSTYVSLKANVDGLGIISQERMTAELSQMLLCDYPDMALGMLRDVNCYSYITNGKYSSNALTDEKIKFVSMLPKKLELRLAALVCGCEDELETLKAMKYPNDVVERVGLFLHYKDNFCYEHCTDIDYLVSRMQYECKTPEAFDDVVTFLDAWYGMLCDDGHHEALKRKMGFYFSFFRSASKTHNMYSYKLPVTGKDVMDTLGLKPSPKVGTVMDHLLGIAFSVNDIKREECIEAIKRIDWL